MEFNREQIIKALECCTSSNSVSACMRGCPIYEKEDCECINDDTALLKYALSLIKELTEENKVRKGLNTMLNNELRRLGEENERLRAEKEGKWLMCGIFDDLAKCSVCGYSEHSLMEVYDKPFRFCPSCGAKMKGE